MQGRAALVSVDSQWPLTGDRAQYRHEPRGHFICRRFEARSRKQRAARRSNQRIICWAHQFIGYT